MSKTVRKYHGIVLTPDGGVMLAVIPISEKWKKIRRILGTTRAQDYSAGYIGGVKCTVVSDAYATASKALNQRATRLCGGSIYGNAVLLTEGKNGFTNLMTEGQARKLLDEVIRR